MIKAQDVLVVVQAACDRQNWTVQSLSIALGLPPATVHRSIRRCAEMGFFRDEIALIDPFLIEEFLTHVVKFEFPPTWAGICDGVPTAWSAAPLNSELFSGDDEQGVVWPSRGGAATGRGLQPIHPVLPGLADSNTEVYEWMTLVDAIRIGGARDRSVAGQLLRLRIDGALSAAA